MYSIFLSSNTIPLVAKTKATEEIIISYKDYIKMSKEERNSYLYYVIRIGYNQIMAIKDSLSAFRGEEFYITDIPVSTTKQEIYDMIDLLDKNGVFFFFAQGQFVAMNQEQMEQILELGVSQVFIAGEFCFDIDMIKYYSGLTKLRLIPNAALSSTVFNRKNMYMNWFCRPENIDIYEPYCTIQLSDDEEHTRINVLYNIYKARKWEGKLSDIIDGLTEDIDNNKLPLNFGEVRSRCCKNKCYKCRFCTHAVSFASIIGELPIAVKRKEKVVDEDTAYEKLVSLHTERPEKDTSSDL